LSLLFSEYCSEKTAAEDAANEQKEVINQVNAEISHIESLMTNELQQNMAEHEHAESTVQLPGLM